MTTYLGMEIASDRRAGGEISLHDLTDHLYSLAAGEIRQILVCLSKDLVPLMPNVSSDSLNRSLGTHRLDRERKEFLDCSCMFF